MRRERADNLRSIALSENHRVDAHRFDERPGYKATGAGFVRSLVWWQIKQSCQRLPARIYISQSQYKNKSTAATVEINNRTVLKSTLAVSIFITWREFSIQEVCQYYRRITEKVAQNVLVNDCKQKKRLSAHPGVQTLKGITEKLWSSQLYTIRNRLKAKTRNAPGFKEIMV